MKKALLLVSYLFAIASFSTLQTNAQNSPLGINIGGLADWSTEIPFQDQFKMARPWISQISGGGWGTGPTPLDVDDNGYVRSLANSNAYVTTVIQTGVDGMHIGVWHLYYEGTGTLTIWGDHISNISTVSPGHMRFSVTAKSSIFLDIRGINSSTYVKKIRCVPDKYLSTYTTEIFNPDFIKNIQGYKVIRFMDWLATNGNPSVQWSNRTTPESFTQFRPEGVSLEYIVRLCNKLKASPWVCIPHKANDDYITRAATLLRDSLDPALKIYVEYSNEIWNGMFSQSTFAGDTAVTLGLCAANAPWEGKPKFFAKRSVEIFKSFETVFGGLSRLMRVVAWQQGGLSGPLGYVVAPGDTCYEYADAGAIAPYFANELDGDANVANMTVDQVLDWCEHYVNKKSSELYPQVAYVKSLYNKQGKQLVLTAYEAGQHLTGINGLENNTTMTNNFIAANRHVRMGQIYTDYLQRWKEAGAQVMCIFASMGDYSKWGSWGIVENYNQVENTPKGINVLGFQESNTPAWWNVTPVIAPVGSLAVDFMGSSIPNSGVSLKQAWQSSGDTMRYIPFSTANNNNIFNCAGYDMGQFYGGAVFKKRPSTAFTPSFSLNSGSDKFVSTIDNGNAFSQISGIFIWRKDQFLNGNSTASNVKIGKLRINLNNATFASVRFVIKSEGKYYVSDWMAGSNGLFEIDNINNSALATRRWMEYTFTTTNFETPKPFKTLQTTNPTTFNDVTEVGFMFVSERPSWGHSFEFNEFKAYTISDEMTVIVKPGIDQANPTGNNPVKYITTFSHPVTDFIASDVVYGGASGPTNVVIKEIAPNDHTTYEISVSGMTKNGIVYVSVPAGVATSGALSNKASTSINNSVYYNNSLSTNKSEILESGLEIYPVPTSNSITIKSVNSIQQISIYSIDGVLRKQLTASKNEETIDISDLQNGIYLVSIQSEDIPNRILRIVKL